ncbi:MAG: T9SS type A sorting domain-containing protein [Bacteroidales bacterium]|nr:T9SS type A sorting domain-containing protein [Bacteroidales bacterium]
MRLLFAFLLVFAFESMSAQIFKLKLGDELDNIGGKTMTLGSGDFITVMKSGEYPYDQNPNYSLEYELELINISNSGELLNTYEFPVVDTIYRTVITMFEINNSIVVWGCLLNLDYIYEGNFISTFDMDLNLISENVLIEDNGKYGVNCIVNSNGNYVLAGYYPNNEMKNTFIQEYTTDFELVNEMYYDQLIVPQNIIEFITLDHYQISNIFSAHTVDFDFNYLECIFNQTPSNEFVDLMESQLYCGQQSVVAASCYEYSSGSFPYRDMGICVYDSNYELVDYVKLGRIETNEKGRYLDYLSTDSIFIGGTADQEGYFGNTYVFNNRDRYFSVCNVSMTNGEHWNVYHGGDGDYNLMDVVATPDGGCLLTGTYFDWRNNPVQERDIFIMKIDKDGNYFATDVPQVAKNEMCAYPNPVSSTFYIKGISEPANIEIYATDGRMQLNTSIQSSNEAIDVNQLKSGIYFYKVLSGGKFLGSGKFIKN